MPRIVQLCFPRFKIAPQRSGKHPRILLLFPVCHRPEYSPDEDFEDGKDCNEERQAEETVRQKEASETELTSSLPRQTGA